jgi:hypothetical protein
MNEEIENQDRVVELVKAAKRHPLPKSSKVLFLVLVFALVFTGGIAYGKHKASSTPGNGLSLSALGAGGIGTFGGGGNFAGGRVRNGGSFNIPTGATGGTLPSDGTGSGSVAVATDVAGTVISVTDKEMVVETLSGEKQTFPITDTTKVRESSKLDLSKVKSGDIVTIKPDEANAAKTITVVK